MGSWTGLRCFIAVFWWPGKYYSWWSVNKCVWVWGVRLRMENDTTIIRGRRKVDIDKPGSFASAPPSWVLVEQFSMSLIRQTSNGHRYNYHFYSISLKPAWIARRKSDKLNFVDKIGWMIKMFNFGDYSLNDLFSGSGGIEDGSLITFGFPCVSVWDPHSCLVVKQLNISGQSKKKGRKKVYLPLL